MEGSNVEQLRLERAQIARTPHDRGLYLALAPMDGVTDWVHRKLATELGGVSQCVTEFVRVTDRAPPKRVFVNTCPELLQGGLTASGVPVFVQLLGGDVRAMAAAAVVASELGAPGIDINFGCPAKRVNNHDGGASILRGPERAGQITRAVRDAVKRDIPVSAKIRLGWSDSDSVIEIAQHVEEGGAAWLTIHGRTKAQMYAPPVDYRAIGRARAALKMPVVANGDIATPEAMLACAVQSGARSFMLGRGALARPYLFRTLRGEPGCELESLWSYCQVLRRYEQLMEQGGFLPNSRLSRMKQWLSLARTFDSALVPLFDRIKRASTIEDALLQLELPRAA
ncbi:MAG: dusC 2 [Myxococcaceae bacterium]|nr:dusC 2 [Myxococcaceae bacterium]